MLLEHERNYGLGMDALVSVCSWNTNGIMVLPWMLWSAYALGTRTGLWFWHGCSGQRMLLEQDRNYGLCMDAVVSVCSWNTNGIMVLAWMLWSAYAAAEHDLAAYAGGRAKVSGCRQPSFTRMFPDTIMGKCRASPGTWRTRAKLPVSL